MNKDWFNNRFNWTGIVLGLCFLLLFSTSYNIATFAQTDCQADPFECDAPISDLTQDVTQIHIDEAKFELAKIPPNKTGAQFHDNLAGLSVQEISKIGDAGSVTLSPENIQKLDDFGAENCYIKSNATVICFGQ